jgi:hypothetical protein
MFHVPVMRKKRKNGGESSFVAYGRPLDYLLADGLEQHTSS